MEIICVGSAVVRKAQVMPRMAGGRLSSSVRTGTAFVLADRSFTSYMAPRYSRSRRWSSPALSQCATHLDRQHPLSRYSLPVGAAAANCFSCTEKVAVLFPSPRMAERYRLEVPSWNGPAAKSLKNTGSVAASPEPCISTLKESVMARRPMTDWKGNASPTAYLRMFSSVALDSLMSRAKMLKSALARVAGVPRSVSSFMPRYCCRAR